MREPPSSTLSSSSAASDVYKRQVYAMDGNLQKVTNYIFVITPSSVDISGNFDEMLDGSIDLSGSSKYVFKN